MMRMNQKPNESSSASQLSPEEREFISDEISRQRAEGRPQDQAVAIAFSKARERFGNDKFDP